MAVELPSVENGPNGRPSARCAPPAPIGKPSQAADAGAPSPDSPPRAERHRPGCVAAVPPDAGRCPGCGVFQVANPGPVTHGLRSKKLAAKVDAYRVDLIEQLFAERGGRDALDVVSRIAIENYALVCAQHKTIEARLDSDGLFTQTGRRRSAFDMLKGISETIDRLRSELPPVVASARPTSVDYSGLSDDELIEQLEATLDQVRSSRMARVEVASAPRTPDVAALDSPEARIRPEPSCGFGCGSLDRCAELKTTRPDTWQTLHYADPNAVPGCDTDATEVMVRQVGKTSPW